MLKPLKQHLIHCSIKDGYYRGDKTFKKNKCPLSDPEGARRGITRWKCLLDKATWMLEVALGTSPMDKMPAGRAEQQSSVVQALTLGDISSFHCSLTPPKPRVSFRLLPPPQALLRECLPLAHALIQSVSPSMCAPSLLFFVFVFALHRSSSTWWGSGGPYGTPGIQPRLTLCKSKCPSHCAITWAYLAVLFLSQLSYSAFIVTQLGKLSWSVLQAELCLSMLWLSLSLLLFLSLDMSWWVPWSARTSCSTNFNTTSPLPHRECIS